VAGSALGLAGGLTTEEWLLILGILVTVINALIEYLSRRKKE